MENWGFEEIFSADRDIYTKFLSCTLNSVPGLPVFVIAFEQHKHERRKGMWLSY